MAKSPSELQLQKFLEDCGLWDPRKAGDNILYQKTVSHLHTKYSDTVVVDGKSGEAEIAGQTRLVDAMVGVATGQIQPGGSASVPAGTQPDKKAVETLIEQTAQKFNIPTGLLKAVKKLESGWRQFDASGQPVQGVNRDKATGAVKSTDWGIGQINDKAHPDAFPRAKTDLVYNLEYGANYLSNLFKRHGNWRDAVASYNAGSPRRTQSGAYVNQAYVDRVAQYARDFGYNFS